MARSLRIEFPGAYYHVTSRGNERKNIFKDSRDRKQFLSYLRSAYLRYKAVIHAYCLMSNHYHILIGTPKGNLSKIMHHINGAYTTYFNIRHQRTGHLFQGRYKAILVDADAYAGELSRYIHLNPVKAGLVDIPEKYEWSSYAYYVGKGKKPDWLTVDFIAGYFDGKGMTPQKRYEIFVGEKINCSYESPLQNTIASTILGSDDFIEHVRENYMKSIKAANNDRDLPAARELALNPGINDICDKIKSLTSADSAIFRNVTIYLCHKYSGKTLKEIGNYFGIRESSVSQASTRFSGRLDNDKILKKKVDHIQKKLNL